MRQRRTGLSPRRAVCVKRPAVCGERRATSVEGARQAMCDVTSHDTCTHFHKHRSLAARDRHVAAAHRMHACVAQSTTRRARITPGYGFRCTPYDRAHSLHGAHRTPPSRCLSRSVPTLTALCVRHAARAGFCGSGADGDARLVTLATRRRWLVAMDAQTAVLLRHWQRRPRPCNTQRTHTHMPTHAYARDTGRLYVERSRAPRFTGP